MPTAISFDEADAERLKFLASHYDQRSCEVRIDAIPGMDKLNETQRDQVLHRWQRYGLIETRTNLTIAILPKVLDVVHEMKNPPLPNHWQQLIAWWYSKKWAVGITVVFVVLSLLLPWIQLVVWLFR